MAWLVSGRLKAKAFPNKHVYNVKVNVIYIYIYIYIYNIVVRRTNHYMLDYNTHFMCHFEDNTSVHIETNFYKCKQVVVDCPYESRSSYRVVFYNESYIQGD